MSESLRRGRRFAALCACALVAVSAGGASAAPKPATFGDPQSLPFGCYAFTGAYPYFAAGDFNGDGSADLVTTANSESGGYVKVCYGDQTGGFQDSLAFPLKNGHPAVRLAVGDLNGDGRDDVVVHGGGAIDVFLASADATVHFAAPTEYAAPGVGGLAIAELDGQKQPDIVALTDSSVLTFTNNGDGTFAGPTTVSLKQSPADASPQAFSIVAADLDGDGNADLAVSELGTSSIAFLHNRGGGEFDPTGTRYPTGDSVLDMIGADLNGDGRPDLVTTHFLSTAAVTLHLNDGHGAFPSGHDVSLPGAPGPTTAADVNGDGALDLASVQTSGIALLLGNGAGGFVSGGTASTGSTGAPSAVVAADVNRDGKPGLAFLLHASNSAAEHEFVLPNTTPEPGWQPPETPSADSAISSPQLSFDGHGNLYALWHEDLGGGDHDDASSVRSAETGKWEDPQFLSPIANTSTGGVGQEAQLAVNAAGDAAVAYYYKTSTLVAINGDYRSTGSSTWETYQPIVTYSNPPAGAGFADPEIALDAAGDAVAAWFAYVPDPDIPASTDYTVWASIRPAATSNWGTPFPLSTLTMMNPLNDWHPLGLASDATHVYAVWQQNERIELATIDPQSGQHPTTPLTTVNTIAPRVAADPAGDLVVAWHNPGLSVDEAAVRPAGGSFPAPTPIPASGPRFALAMAPNGTALLVGNNGTAALHKPGGSWTTNTIPSMAADALPSATVDSSGGAIALWQRGIGGGQNVIEAAALAPGASAWGPVRLLGGGTVGDRALALDAAGDPAAIWADSFPHVRAYDVLGPKFDATVPAAGTVGQTLSFSATAGSDFWSPPAGAPAWSFGDGSTATGVSLSHTYATSGTFTVTASEPDAVGNTSTISRQVEIAAAPPPPPPPPGPPPPPPPPPTVHCVVPKVVGKKLAVARRAIVRAHCKVGKVKKRYSRRVRKGRVISESPKAHRRLAAHAKVNLVVSRGRRPRRRHR